MKDLELNVLKESASQLRVPALLRVSASLCRVGGLSSSNSDVRSS